MQLIFIYSHPCVNIMISAVSQLGVGQREGDGEKIAWLVKSQCNKHILYDLS